MRTRRVVNGVVVKSDTVSSHRCLKGLRLATGKVSSGNKGASVASHGIIHVLTADVSHFTPLVDNVWKGKTMTLKMNRQISLLAHVMPSSSTSSALVEVVSNSLTLPLWNSSHLFTTAQSKTWQGARRVHTFQVD